MRNNRNWLQTIEYLSLAGSVAGSVAAVLSQQIVYALAPLTFSLALNLTNRRSFEQKNIKISTTALQEINQQIERLDSAKKEWSGAIQLLIQQLENQAKSIEPAQYSNLQNSEISDLKNKQISLEIALGTLGQEIYSLNQQFSNRPELKQIETLAEIILALRQSIDALPTAQNSPISQQIEPQTKAATEISLIEEINQQLQTLETPYEYELIMKPNPHQNVLEEALQMAQKQLIIVSPWIRQQPIPNDILEKFRSFLNRSISFQIGWTNSEPNFTLQQFQELAKEFPEKIKFKQVETHENFIVCDESFAWVGSHSVFNKTSSNNDPEIGVRTTDPLIIQELISRFNQAPNLNLL